MTNSPSVTERNNCHSPAPRTRLFVDTETLGLEGIPFLVQYRPEGAQEVRIVRVFETPPAEITALLRSWVDNKYVLVGHNLMFDLVVLSKLLTVADLVSDWSFDSIWQAEALWQGKVSYLDRLQHLRLLYPVGIEDTLIAAQTLLPLAEELMRPVSIHMPRLPVPVVDDVAQALRAALTNRPFRDRHVAGLTLSHNLRAYVEGATDRAGRAEIASCKQQEDWSAQRAVRYRLRVRGAYSLKSIAPLLGYPGEVRRYDFLDDFGRIPRQVAPTYSDRSLYERLYEFARRVSDDSEFLEYSRRDVDMLAFVHRHYSREEGYDRLADEFAILPYMANLRLYGVHVDPARREAARSWHAARLKTSAGHLATAGLTNYNSGKKVTAFVNRLLKSSLAPASRKELGPVSNMKDETLDQVLRFVTGRLGEASTTVGHLVHLRRARRAHKFLQFFEAVVGDTLYPKFAIKGTQTHRMTSSRPAVQTIPKLEKGEDESADFRRAFTAPPGYQLLVGDFDQFEMRLAAAESGEEVLRSAFRQDKDLDTHALTALRTMEPAIRKTDPRYARMSQGELLQALAAKDPKLKVFRDQGKVLNFATMYGASPWGVARLAGVTVDQAEQMLAAFREAYPALDADIQQVHEQLTLFSERAGRFAWPTAVETEVQTRVANRYGLRRNFGLPLRIIEVLLKLADDPAKYLPSLAHGNGFLVPYYDGRKTPVRIVASQLRFAARRLQGYVHRQAYNFRIQSLGACLTKRLQSRVAGAPVPPGVHRASDLNVLPGINVHDEIHLLVRGEQNQVHEKTTLFRGKLSEKLGVPIKFEFEEVVSWADKP